MSSRLVSNNQVIVAQVDFFQADGYTRVVGLAPADIEVGLFFDNLKQPWSCVDGSRTTSVQVSSGVVYFNEITGALGYYGLRFRPNAVGYWRLVTTYPAGKRIVVHDFDVVAPSTNALPGLKPSFVK